MKLVYHPQAKEDLRQTTKYYAQINYDLGNDFKLLFQEAALHISDNPFRYRVVRDDIRKCSMKRFPHAIYFRIQEDTVQILVVKHHRRHPDFGMNR